MNELVFDPRNVTKHGLTKHGLTYIAFYLTSLGEKKPIYLLNPLWNESFNVKFFVNIEMNRLKTIAL